MYPDHSVSGVDRARGRGRGMGGRSARRRRAVVGRLARSSPRCRYSRWRSASSSSRRCWPGRSCARCGACRNGSGAAAASGVTRAAATPSRKACSRSATAIPPRPAPMPMSRAAMPRTIRWRCCCTRNRRSSTATAPARSARSAPWPSARTRRLLGLRGLFIEAQRADDPVAAVMIAEEALKLAPSSTWASHAVLGFRCAKGDWSGALAILDNNLASGPDRQAGLSAPARRAADGARAGTGNCRSRPVARQRDGSGQAGADAGAGRGARQQISERGASGAALDADRRSGLAGAAASRSRRRLCPCEARRFRAAAAGAGRDAGGESARPSRGRAGGRARRDRCHRICARARGAGAVRRRADPAGGDADGGDRAHRAWRQRPGAGLDPARGARAARSGLDRGRLCFSDRWRPVSPVSGRLDAFQWQTPLAALPSDKSAAIEASPFEEAMLAPPPRRVEPPYWKASQREPSERPATNRVPRA